MTDYAKGIKDWGATAFATPVALSALAKLRPELDFSALLERVILAFDKVSYHLWNGIFGWLDVDIETLHGSLTFIAICAGVVIRERLFFNEEKRLEAFSRLDYRFFVETACISFLLAILVFNATDFRSIALLAALIAVPVNLLFFVDHKRPEKWKDAGTTKLLFSALLIIGYLIGESHKVWGVYSPAIFFGAIMGSFLSTFSNVVGPRRLFFTRIVVFAAGVFIIDFFAKTGIPALETWLKTIGA